MKTKFDINRKKENSLIAETELQVDQKKGKLEAKFIKPFFI